MEGYDLWWSTLNGTNTVLAIVAIATITLAAISKVIDGNIIYLGIIAIAGLGGYEVYKTEKKEE